MMINIYQALFGKGIVRLVDVVEDRVVYRVNGIELVASQRGSGPRVLLLHGGGQTRHSWDRTAERLAAHGYTAIAVDMRGHGESGWSPDGVYGVYPFARDLRALLDRFDDRPAVVGASMGGVAGLLALGDEPDGGVSLARCLVLVDVTPRMEPDGIERIRGFMNSAPDGFASLDEAADAVAAYLPGRPRPGSTAGLAKNLRLRAGRYHWHWDPLMMDGFTDQQELHALLTERARNIRVPSLLVRGARSDVVSEQGMQELVTLIPHVRLSEVGGAGHMVAGDSNDPFSTGIIEFLDSL